MIKVLHIIDSYSFGGAQEIILNIGKYIDKSKFALTVISLYGEGDIKTELQSESINTFSLSKSKYNIFTITYNLFRHLRNVRYDIVNLHLEVSTILGTMIVKLMGVKHIVVSVHALKEQPPFWAYSAYAKLSLCISRFVLEDKLALSDLSKLGVDKKKLMYIPIGTDFLNLLGNLSNVKSTIRENLGIAADTHLILNIARLHPRKGHIFLLKAMKQVIQKEQNAIMLIVGYGDEQKKLESISVKLGLEKHVIFLGVRRDLINLYLCCDVFAVSAIDEGMGVVIYQAMSCGKPIVAFNAGSINEVVIDKITGRLVPNRDWYTLALEIIKLLENRKLRDKYGIAGRQRIKNHFQAVKMVKKYENVYYSLAGK